MVNTVYYHSTKSQHKKIVEFYNNNYLSFMME